MRDAKLRGRWEVPPRIRATAGRGSVRIDFTEAVVKHDEIVVDARPNWRNVEIVCRRATR